MTTRRSGKIQVDPEDEHVLDWFSWFVTDRGYVEASAWCHGSKTRRTIKLHRLLVPVKDGQQIDHINGDPTDNRKCNLRITDSFTNAQNRDYVRNAQCIRWDGYAWEVRVRRNGVTHYSRTDTFDEAVEERDAIRAENKVGQRQVNH